MSFHIRISRYLIPISYLCIMVSVICILSSLSIYTKQNSQRQTYPSYKLFDSLWNSGESSLNDIQINGNKSFGKMNEKFGSDKNMTHNEENQKKFRINTKGCKISDLPLFDSETKKLFENKTETTWKCKNDWIKVERINYTSVRFDWSSVKKKPICYYRKLSRGKDDFSFDYGPFNGPVVDPIINLPDFEFVHIVCYKYTKGFKVDVNKPFNKKHPNLIHDQIIPLIPVVNKTSDSDIPNVLLLAIDSTSYINFRRHFIRTEKLLRRYNFFEMKGYNKVGANTFPNMIPFLTGHHSYELVSSNDLMKIKFDDWPIVWKKYAAKGFVTAFVEEMPKYGLFQYKRQGFSSKPTDYETRPFHMEIKKDKYNEGYCYRDRTETEVMSSDIDNWDYNSNLVPQHSLDFTLDFLRAMKNRNQKFFAYISISEMVHDWLNGGHYMDVPYSKLFTHMFEENLVDNTVIMFFSDHGLRVGPIRETHSGEMENRLPFMFMRLPETIDSEWIKNVKQNQYRLTTHFDSHATLTHLVDGQPNRTLPHGFSLFDSVISDERDCESASIPDMFCACYEDVPVDDPEAIKPNQTIPKIVDKLNSLTDKFRSQCSRFTLESVKSVYNRSSSQTAHTSREYKLGDTQFFIVQIYVNPGKALFEVLIRGYDHNTRFEIIGDITRISRYGNQSHCIEDKMLRNYCYCNDLL